jgi:hypothetical protein
LHFKSILVAHSCRGLVYAWYYESGPGKWELTTKQWNGVTTGLALSDVLERADDANPQAVVILSSYGFFGCSVQCDSMTLTDGNVSHLLLVKLSK